MTRPSLRPDYQVPLVQRVRAAWAQGARNVLMRLDTGGGKTVCLGTIVDEEPGPSCVIAHRGELVGQLSLTLARYGVRHDLIASTAVKRIISALHVAELGKCYVTPGAKCKVASVDTLVRRTTALEAWARMVRLWVVDESAHLVLENKWHTAVKIFTHPEVRGLGPTATPVRADGKGLGTPALGGDGVFDAMVEGPPMRWLIERGYLADYDVVMAESDLKLLDDEVGTSGDWSPTKMREASRKSHIIGDVVEAYRKWADGKLAMTFCTDVETASDIAQAFRTAGVPAEMLTGETDDRLRAQILHRFERREILQLVSVDVISEGFDCLSMDTEILTPSGFKFFSDIARGDDCYSLNVETREMEVVPVMGVADRPAKEGENVLTVVSQHMDIRVTEGHRIFYRTVNPRRIDGMSPDIRVQTAKDVYDKRTGLSIPISAEASFRGVPLSDDELSLIGWYLTDGNIGKKGAVLTIAQSKVWGVNKICELLDRLGFDYTWRSRKVTSDYPTELESYEFRIPKGNHTGKLKRKGWGHLAPYLTKEISPLLHDMTRAQFRVMWEAILDGDGTRQKGKSGTLTCARKGQADAYVHMAIVRGFAAMYGTYKSKSGTTIYNVRMRDRQWHMLAPKDARGARFSLVPAEPGERFWCVENRNGTIVTRRNGRVVILGNCPAVEVAQLARPTQSLGLFRQQVGRALRAKRDGSKALIIDHVGNFLRHGPPDRPIPWTLARRDKRSRGTSDAIPLRSCTCTGLSCEADHRPGLPREPVCCVRSYERFHTACPYCGHVPVPAGRSSPEQVEGDLELLDPAVLDRLRGAVVEADRSIDEVRQHYAATGLPDMLVRAQVNRHAERCEAQERLRAAIAAWGVARLEEGLGHRERQKLFMLTYGVDVLSARGLGRAESEVLLGRINLQLHAVAGLP